MIWQYALATGLGLFAFTGISSIFVTRTFDNGSWPEVLAGLGFLSSIVLSTVGVIAAIFGV